MQSKAPHICILLSTYNGAQYLPALLDSVLQQDYTNFSLHIRDDGSCDATTAILQEYAARQPHITVSLGANLGVVQSFITLLQQCAVPDAFYAFCDQDDIWLPDKLSAAMHYLQQSPTPSSALYCSRLLYTDAQLQPLGLSQIPHYFGFANALVENAAIGCTMVFGAAIRAKICRADAQQMMMHDWWAYLVASAFGQVYYDPTPHIQYRQHAANVVGWDKRFSRLAKKSVGFLANLLWHKQGLQCLQQAAALISTYPELAAEHRQQIEEVLALRTSANLRQRYRYLQRTTLHRNHHLEDRVLWWTILLRLH